MSKETDFLVYSNFAYSLPIAVVLYKYVTYNIDIYTFLTIVCTFLLVIIASSLYHKCDEFAMPLFDTYHALRKARKYREASAVVDQFHKGKWLTCKEGGFAINYNFSKYRDFVFARIAVLIVVLNIIYIGSAKLKLLILVLSMFYIVFI